ncbi:hypothetical protein J437_LFUL004004 [Ladona fulva]|uniref:Uncharacterized protein n=1 Tax=Ladona fulva TaxID=123851 RepID=A0A8K0K1T2_LADFU|nr:hypothetical protein J437_LFUL004004 [Ladona fulva]
MKIIWPTLCQKETAVGVRGRSKGKGYGTFYAGSGCGQIFRCIVEEGLCEKFTEEKENEVYTLDIDVTSSTLTSGGKDTIIRSYDITTKKLLKSYERSLLDDYKGHNARIFSIRCDPQEQSIFYSGGWDNVVKVSGLAWVHDTS